MENSTKKNIAIIMGGYSSEYQISMTSGQVVFQHLNREKYEPFRVVISIDSWYYLDENDQHHPIDKNDFSVKIGNEKIKFDVVFNAIHGTPGEDGLMQAYFQLLKIPQTSCNYYQAALTFNKRDLLSVLKPFGINSAKSYYLNQGEPIRIDHIIEEIGLPCFVKPNRSGSSFGISKVKEKAALLPAIEKAFEEDHEILIEAFLDGTEISVGVITYQNRTLVLPMTEIVSENEFFDYEAKYLGKSQEITPARIDENTRQKVMLMAQKAYEALHMKGFSRSEFILVNGEPYMLEMNTVPGLTAESLLPQQAKAAGIELSELFENAIESAHNEAVN